MYFRLHDSTAGLEAAAYSTYQISFFVSIEAKKHFQKQQCNPTKHVQLIREQYCWISVWDVCAHQKMKAINVPPFLKSTLDLSDSSNFVPLLPFPFLPFIATLVTKTWLEFNFWIVCLHFKKERNTQLESIWLFFHTQKLFISASLCLMVM